MVTSSQITGLTPESCDLKKDSAFIDNNSNKSSVMTASKIKNTFALPSHLSEIFTIGMVATKPDWKVLDGVNRTVAINKDLGIGFKYFKDAPESEYHASLDLRLNDIYKDEAFYNGKYSNYAKNEVVSVIDDLGSKGENKIFLSKFEILPESIALDENESIPLSFLKYLRDELDYKVIDHKNENWVKILNQEGKYDFIPIDGKYIGRARSNSLRSTKTQKINTF